MNQTVGPDRSFLSQPRPLNPDLDIHFDQNQILDPTHNLNPRLSSPPIPVPKRESERLWKESDFQLAVVPSSSSSSSLLELERREEVQTDKLNIYLGQCGLPTIDFSRMTSQNKDHIVGVNLLSNTQYQDYIYQIAEQYDRRESLMKKMAKRTLYTQDDKQANDLVFFC